MTWELLILILTICFFFYYCFFVLSTRKGLRTLVKPQAISERPFVSVLISARNEQETLSACLESVLCQDYPVDTMEVILVDDGSTDNTSSIAKKFASLDTRLRLLILPNAYDNPKSRKPAALAAGIQMAKGEIILTTDADCVVGREWISSMIHSFDSATAFVAGPVQELPSSHLISRLSQIEFLGLIGTSAGLIANGKPIICNGANVAYRRTSFFEVNGYGTSPGFCDDEVLMHRIKSRGLGSIRYSIDSRSMVTTNAPSSLIAFWKQRIRWASKRGHYEDNGILLRLTGLYMFFLFLMILVVTSFVSPYLFPFLGILFVSKILVDYATLETAAQTFGQQVHIRFFVIAELLHVPYIVFAALAGQFSSLEWKGQRIRG